MFFHVHNLFAKAFDSSDYTCASTPTTTKLMTIMEVITILMITIMLIMVSVLFKIDKDSSIADKYEHTSLPTKDCSKTYLFGRFSSLM